MSRRYRLTPRAASDLSGIFQYSAVTWNVRQAEHYLTRLYDAAAQIADNPKLGVSRPDIGEGIRAIRVQSHYLFYRTDGTEVRILRVLHVRQYAEATGFDNTE